MSSARKPSGFLQLNYDKIAIVAVLAGLLGTSVTLLLRLNGEAKDITDADLQSASPIAAQPLDATPLEALSDAIARPYEVPAAQRRMLVGELRVSSIPDGLPIPFEAEICPFTQQPQPASVKLEERDSDGDGMPDVWETKYGFNMNDPGDAQADTDADGFTNIEEFQAESLPGDNASTPPPSAKLRLVRAQVNPFKLLFRGTSSMPNGEMRYQLNLRSNEKTYFARMDEDVEGFKVMAYDEKDAEGPALTLQKGDKIIKLVQGRVRDEQAYTALLIFLVDGQRFRSSIGSVINLIGTDYKVVDIREDRVVIRDEKSGRDIEVGKISDEERNALSAGGI